MKENNEVTLKIVEDFEKFKIGLIEKGYKINNHFCLHDIYMIPIDLELSKMTTREILSKALIIRTTDEITNNQTIKEILYKIKTFNSNRRYNTSRKNTT